MYGLRPAARRGQPIRSKKAIRSIPDNARDLLRSLPSLATAPGFKPRRLADGAKIHQRRDRPMVQSVQPLAAQRPSCLLRHAARAADCEDHTSPGGEIHSATLAVFDAVLENESIGHELH